MGAYGCPITRNMKFRVPKNLVEYIFTGKLEDLKTVTYRGETNKKEMLNAGANSLTGKKKRELQRRILNGRQF